MKGLKNEKSEVEGNNKDNQNDEGKRCNDV